MQPQVLAINDPLIQKALRDFRLDMGIAKIKGEGKFKSSAFPEFETKNVLLEIIEQGVWAQNLPPLFSRWLQALRLPYLLFSLFPILLVFSAFFHLNNHVQPLITFLLVSSITCLHIACNLWGDYEDHLRGIDSTEHQGGSGVIQKLWIPAVHLRNSAAVLFATGIILGFILFLQMPYEPTGKKILWLGITSALAIASFSGWPFHYKYLGLGEPMMFLLSGPVVTFGASLVYFKESNYFIWFALISLPLAFLATLRLHAGNLQRIPFDSMANAITVARLIGFQKSKLAYVFLLFAPFLCVLCFWAFRIVPNFSLLSLLALPYLYFPLKNIWIAKGPLDPACNALRRDAATLHFLFGFIYCISFLF